jgi:hypothetical protein
MNNSINVSQTITIDDDTDTSNAPINGVFDVLQMMSAITVTDPVVAHVSDVSDGNSC